MACWRWFLLSTSAAARTTTGFPWLTLLVGVASFAGGLLLLGVAFRSLGSHDAGTGDVGPRDVGLPWSRPLPLLGLLALLGVAATFLGVLTVALHDDGSRSSAVQHHGVRARGVVTAVHAMTVTSDSGRYGTTIRVTSYLDDVALASPVRGVRVTTVHAPRFKVLRKGAGVEVLLDPRDLSYAEIPGAPMTAKSGWVYLLVGSLAAWLGLVVALYRRCATPSSRPDGD